jgi:hypothetical protein
MLANGTIVFDGRPSELMARAAATTLEEAYARELARQTEHAA